MTHPTPTAEEFLAQHEPEEDDLEAAMADWKASPGMLHVLPPDPMERIAEALETIAGSRRPSLTLRAEAVSGAAAAAEIARLQKTPENTKPVSAEDATAYLEQITYLQQSVDDVASHAQALTQVISDVEAALGKSKAAPALAAKAVIEAWKNPQVPETVEPDPAHADGLRVNGSLVPDRVAEPEGVPTVFEDKVGPVELAPGGPVVPGHTRTPHPEGPDFCRECSGELQGWVQWPCPAVSGEAQPLATGPEEGHEPLVQPEHNAPVEEWRAYARALGYAGPEIDKANRSVIRTTLGIAQPVAGA